MLKVLFFFLFFCLPAIAFAHSDPASGGFWVGVQHPVLGFDHLLAMVSVGIISAQIGGRSIWLIPLIFVSVMMIGGLTGLYGIPIPYFSIEHGIAASVLILGTGIVFYRQVPILVISFFVGFFAIFHGHAHGLEIPIDALPVTYILGFMVGTASLHLAGVLIGFVGTRNKTGDLVLRSSGVVVAGIGAAFLFLGAA